MLVVGVVLLVCTLGTRLPAAVHNAFWQDEIGALRVVSRPTLRQAIRQIVKGESTPPVFYLTARALDRTVSGLGAVRRAQVLRVLPLSFSLACTALTFVLALELMPLWGAALAGLLASFASLLFVHGYELRAYSLLAASCVAFVFLLERAVARPTFRRLALLAGVVAAGSLTHYFFLLTLAAGALWVLLSRPSRSLVLRLGITLIVGLVPLALWSPFWLEQYRNGIYATAPPLSLRLLVDLAPTFFAPQPLVHNLGTSVAVLVTLALLAATVLLLRNPTGRLCAFCVLVPVLTVTAVVAVTGDRVFNPRNLIGVVPFAAIALAWGCTALPWRPAAYAAGALVGALVVAGFAYGQANLGTTPYDRIADAVAAQGYRPGDPIVWFGKYGGLFPPAWYLAARQGEPKWPLIRNSSPTGVPCRGVTVVARGLVGRRWLSQHRELIRARSSVPQYGDSPLARRGADAIVARLAWSQGILALPKGASAPFLFHLHGTSSPCLRR